MSAIIGFALEHWIMSGWVLLAISLAFTQSDALINGTIREGKLHIYETLVNVIVGAGFLWVIISAIAILKNIWLTV